MTKTSRLAHVAILGALSFGLMFLSFPIIPGADFLKVELSILPVLLAYLVLDLKSAYQVLLLRSVLKLLLNNRGVNDWIGLPMNILALGLFVTCLALLWPKRASQRRLLLAGLVGTLVLTVTMLALNAFYAIPLYARFAGFDIATMIGLKPYLLGMVLPFNLIQGLIFSVSFSVLVLPVRKFVKGTARVQ